MIYKLVLCLEYWPRVNHVQSFPAMKHNSKTMPHEKFAFLKTSGDKQVNPSDSYCSATIIKQLVSNYQKGRKKKKITEKENRTKNLKY